MLIFLGVKNFAKIENAKVCINSYTLLVGPNGSGKTYLMQLAQGVNERFANLVDEEGMRILQPGEEQGRNTDGGINGSYKRYIISQDTVPRFVAYLNTKLDEKKEQIVREIFGRDVPVEKLYIEIVFEEKVYYEIISFHNIDINTIEFIPDEIRNLSRNQSTFMRRETMGALIKHDEIKGKNELITLLSVMGDDEVRMFNNIMLSFFECRSLFLPSSRTGIMLLYRDFFANKADYFISYTQHEKQAEKSNYRNLTQPVYEFLRFLQTYTEDQKKIDVYSEEIEFFEEKLIEGHINVNEQNGFSYDSETDHISVPLYMASSMINEIAPFVLALTSSFPYDGLIIDEIEASLHPQKQLELVRFLNRLSNKSIKLMLSTHSDTFASKVNNLYVLSNYVKQNKRDDLIKKMGLEKDDLMSPDKLFVYEFISQPNGKSIVKEIPGDTRTGFQFDLFTDSAMHLYNEALEIGEILQNDQA